MATTTEKYDGIDYDKSGIGQCWVPADSSNCPSDILIDIECEQIDGGITSCDRYVARNGETYR